MIHRARTSSAVHGHYLGQENKVLGKVKKGKKGGVRPQAVKFRDGDRSPEDAFAAARGGA